MVFYVFHDGRIHDDPHYLADTLFILGISVWNQSKLGYGLSGVVFIVYQVSVMLLEGYSCFCF